MKKLIGFIALIISLTVVSCQKEVIIPAGNQNNTPDMKIKKGGSADLRNGNGVVSVDGPGITDPNNDPDARKGKGKMQ